MTLSPPTIRLRRRNAAAAAAASQESVAMAVAELDIAPAAFPAAGKAAAAVRQRGGWLRRMYSPVGAEQAATSPRTTPTSPPGAGAEKPRRGGWLRRLVSRERSLGRRWTKLSGASSRLAAGLRWKRTSGLSLGVRGGCASALLDDVAFRVMYVVEAVVLGLALSCFFCCCGCQI